jgi:hypothetical protein
LIETEYSKMRIVDYSYVIDLKILIKSQEQYSLVGKIAENLI